MSPTDAIQKIVEKKGNSVWSVPPDLTVYEAIKIMSERRIGALPVIENGRLVGIISERDYARKIILQGRASKDTVVREIMTTDVVTITPAQSVEDGMLAMTDHHVRHLPVLAGDSVVGLVSIGDLVNWVISAHREEIHHLKSYIAAPYPA